MRLPPVLALALCCAACATWRVPRRPLQEIVPTIPYGQVRLTDALGFSIILVRPAIVGDSVVGTAKASNTRQAVPLAQIRRAEVRELDAVSTLACILLVTLSVLGVLGGG